MNAPVAARGTWADRYGPWALVTGASDGLGRSFARALAARGLNLILVARRASALERLADEFRDAHGVRCLVRPVDLRDPASAAALDEETARLDVGLVVAAAGFGSIGPFLDRPLDDERDMLAVNAGAVLGIAHAFGRRLRARGRGGLVLFGSVVGFQGTPLSANYAATKAYVQSLVEACLHALGRCTTVRPGVLAKVLGYSLMTLPRPLRSRILREVMTGMLPRDAVRGDA